MLSKCVYLFNINALYIIGLLKSPAVHIKNAQLHFLWEWEELRLQVTSLSFWLGSLVLLHHGFPSARRNSKVNPSEEYLPQPPSKAPWLPCFKRKQQAWFHFHQWEGVTAHTEPTIMPYVWNMHVLLWKRMYRTDQEEKMVARKDSGYNWLENAFACKNYHWICYHQCTILFSTPFQYYLSIFNVLIDKIDSGEPFVVHHACI